MSFEAPEELEAAVGLGVGIASSSCFAESLNSGGTESGCQHQYQPRLQQQQVSRMVGMASGLTEVKPIKNEKQKAPNQTNMNSAEQS